MGVSNVTLGGLSIHDNTKYAVSNDTLTMLEAMAPQEPVMVEMANRPPVYVRSQPQPRPVGLTVWLLRPDANLRKTDYDAMVAAAQSVSGLVALSWTDTSGTRTLMVHPNTFIPSNWFVSATAEMIAPIPYPS